MLLEGRGWHSYLKPEQIKASMTKGKVYLYQMFTEIFAEFETVEEAKTFRKLMKKKDKYWDYDPVATIDTNNAEDWETWNRKEEI